MFKGGILNYMTNIKIINSDITKYLDETKINNVSLTFFDPPFNQGKDYKYFDDEVSNEEYWEWVKTVLKGINSITRNGGSIYFMQREKNTEWVLKCLRETKWELQNLVIWRKMTSAVPGNTRFGKEYQIIAYATKGSKPATFNKLRADMPIPANWKQPRERGVYLTDVWPDIRELTSGYLAGEEPLRDKQGSRLHLQQSPIDLLVRIILSSTMPGDLVFDPCAGTGTTLVVAKQLDRDAIGIEIDPDNAKLIEQRTKQVRTVDNINVPDKIKYYRFTENLEKIWPATEKISLKRYGLYSGESK
jgi:site-specific DNA-methyltransferase (adenine-specific)